MSPSIPTPRDGAAPITVTSNHPRPWPNTRRVVLSFAAATALALVPSGAALACTTPPTPPPTTPTCHWHQHPGCKPVVPPKTPPKTPPTTPATTPPTSPVVVPPTTSTPTTTTPTPVKTTTTATCQEGTSGGDTCHVVTGSPSFTG